MTEPETPAEWCALHGHSRDDRSLDNCRICGHPAFRYCEVCGLDFTAAEWNDRHDSDDGPVHARCCAQCRAVA